MGRRFVRILLPLRFVSQDKKRDVREKIRGAATRI